MKNFIFLFIFLSFASCQKASPDNNLTVIEGKTLDFAGNTPLAGVRLELRSYHQNFAMQINPPTQQYFTSDAAGRYKIEFEASPDSNYSVFAANYADYYFNNPPHSEVGSSPSTGIVRGASQTVNLMFCKAGFVNTKFRNINRFQVDSVLYYVLFDNCNSNTGRIYVDLDHVKLPASIFFQYGYWHKIPIGQKPEAILRAWRGSQLVINRRDTLRLVNHRDTINYEVDF